MEGQWSRSLLCFFFGRSALADLVHVPLFGLHQDINVSLYVLSGKTQPPLEDPALMALINVDTTVGGPAIEKLCGEKNGGKGENLVWPLLPKSLFFSNFFEPITTQSQPSHISIFLHPTFTGQPNSLFFACFGINMPSPKSRDGCKLLELILVPLINCFVNTSGTSRWSRHIVQFFPHQ
jgi:hypothetical protein